MSETHPRAEGCASDACILVIDDSDANLELMSLILDRGGYSGVRLLRDPLRAEEMFAELDVDLDIVDMHMPAMSGVSVMQTLSRLVPPGEFVPMLMVTGDTSVAVREQALGAGAKDFLVKPVDRVEVVQRVRNLLETRDLYTRLRAHTAKLERQNFKRQERERCAKALRRDLRRRIRAVIDDRLMYPVFQPIFNAHTGALVGVEALARFDCDPKQPPNVWFDQATSVGLGIDLEIRAIEPALERLAELPEGVYVSVNCSPGVAASAELASVLRRFDLRRIVLELTEHEQVGDYGRLAAALEPLRAKGLSVAVDDTGSGYASLRHILQLTPAIIKLDIGLVAGIDLDPSKRALAQALVSFAKEIGALVVAEGIETPGELRTVRQLRFDAVQGFFVGKPQTLPITNDVNTAWTPTRGGSPIKLAEPSA